ncbi:MAG TPA: M28 family metallopeptidase [Longimicrobiales bacterium]|nr:M28 family metallopeptidase [Longimicrobiales bacterium]
MPMRVRRSAFLFSVLPILVAGPVAAQAGGSPIPESTRAAADRLLDAALADTGAYARLGELVDRFGPRLSGTPNLERAIDWVLGEMKKDGLENVHGEPVRVPHWVRGEESADLVEPRPYRLHMLGLGGSIGTPAGGITAKVLVVSSFDELERKAADAKGKIVLFDVPFTSYGETVRYRSGGATAAAKAGAVASLIRSVSSFSMQNVHTGAMRYDSTTPRIPHAAISVEDAMMLHRMQDRGDPVVVKLVMGAKTLPDALSRNVVAELRGSEKPDEVVVMGGHIDSWDVGQGAMDDGGGVVAAWEAVRLMKRLGLRPRRTVRVVAWTNEENGTAGGRGYAAAHAAEIPNHVLAIESDGGVFKPLGFGFTGPDAGLPLAQAIGKLLDRIGAGTVHRGEGGADIAALVQRGVPGMGLEVDGSRYFWYHHSAADTLDKLDPHELAQCVATMAVMAFVAADIPDRLPAGAPAAATP